MNNNATKIPLVIVAGIGAPNRVIGKENGLLWHVPADMKRFKSLTLGHPVIMGRKTFESILEILGKPLPGRTNIVITRDQQYQKDDVKVAHSLTEAITLAKTENPTEIHIGGGEEIYKQALPLISRLHITWFYDNKEGDTFFPDFEKDFTVTKKHPIQQHNDLDFQWVDYIRTESL